MKKSILPLFLFMLLSSSVFAQLKVGIQAGINGGRLGYNLENKEHQKEMREDTKYKAGFSFGLISDYNFNDALSLQAGLTFLKKGSGYETVTDNRSYEYRNTHKLTTFFVELPVHVVYKHQNFQIQAGPYMATAIGGRSTWVSTAIVNGETRTNTSEYNLVFINTVDETFTPRSYNTYLRRLDYGLDLGLGYKIEKFLVRANHSWGLPGIDTQREGAEKAKNKRSYRVLSLSLAYFI